MLDVSGKDADEFFEDIGHSNDARAELKKHVIGVVKLSPQEIEKRKLVAEQKKNASAAAGGGLGIIAVVGVLIAGGYFYYKKNISQSL
jgi:cytochrome b involved in lipid metabolism